MPEISRFFGIIIKMFFDDHNPPHFHVEYNENRAIIDLQSLKIIQGSLPKKQLRLIQAWAIIHEQELLDNFERLKYSPTEWKKIDPLN